MIHCSVCYPSVEIKEQRHTTARLLIQMVPTCSTHGANHESSDFRADLHSYRVSKETKRDVSNDRREERRAKRPLRNTREAPS